MLVSEGAGARSAFEHPGVEQPLLRCCVDTERVKHGAGIAAEGGRGRAIRRWRSRELDRGAGAAVRADFDDQLAVARMRVPGDGQRDDLQQETAAEIAPTVALHDVAFAYGDGPTVLEGFDLSVAAGEHIALLAPSGCGKSTLLAMIAGLAAPQTGTIAIGGVPLDDANAAALRARMRWIGQRPHIFAGSARYNITLGRAAEAGETAAIIADMALSHVTGVTGNALIGENGAGLSGGEALRLALARIAVDGKGSIILADEPTAHLDHDTAAHIADALLRLAKGRTLILATHDEALARKMDRIVQLGENRETLFQGRAAE